MSASAPPTTRRRLDSWKEIAAFFDRDERTVSRWEKELGLPVHRLPGTKGRVYAFTDELSEWLAAPKNADAASTGPASADHPGLVPTKFTTPPAARFSGELVPVEPQPPQGITPPSARRYTNILRPVAAAILGIAAVVLVLFYPSTFRNSISGRHSASSAQQPEPVAAAPASPHTPDPEAEQLYLKGRYYWNKRTPGDLNTALDYFMQAIVHDPNYAQAYVGLADCYNLMREYTSMPAAEAYPRALAAAKKAVELDDHSSEAHASLAFVSFFGMWDIDTGLREFRRAIDLDPDSPAAHHWYANALLALCRFPEALTEISRAQALDPASASILADKGNILAAAGRRDEALTLLKQMESRDPSFRSPHLYLKYLYLRSRDYPDFLSEFRKDALLMHDNSGLAVASSAEKGYAEGGPQHMFQSMLQVQQKLYARHLIAPTSLAQTFAMLGNKPEALRYLNAAYDQRDGALLFVQTYPGFVILYDEPAYRDLLVRMGLPFQDAGKQPPHKAAIPSSRS